EAGATTSVSVRARARARARPGSAHARSTSPESVMFARNFAIHPEAGQPENPEIQRTPVPVPEYAPAASVVHATPRPAGAGPVTRDTARPRRAGRRRRATRPLPRMGK